MRVRLTATHSVCCPSEPPFSHLLSRRHGRGAAQGACIPPDSRCASFTCSLTHTPRPQAGTVEEQIKAFADRMDEQEVEEEEAPASTANEANPGGWFEWVDGGVCSACKAASTATNGSMWGGGW